MANEIVKYKNKFNGLNLSSLNAQELNIFISIVSRVRNKGTKLVRFTKEELRELSEFGSKDNKRFVSYMDSVKRKVSGQDLEYLDSDEIHHTVNLFEDFAHPLDYSYIDVLVTDSGYVFFNELTDNFTRFSLHQFASLKSRYSKKMFMLLKQFRTTGVRRIKKDDLYLLLSIPKAYTSNNVNQKVIRPIMKELSPFFENLKIDKVKKHNRIVGYVITFKKEDSNAEDFDHAKSVDNEWKAFDTTSDIIQHGKIEPTTTTVKPQPTTTTTIKPKTIEETLDDVKDLDW